LQRLKQVGLRGQFGQFFDLFIPGVFFEIRSKRLLALNLALRSAKPKNRKGSVEQQNDPELNEEDPEVDLSDLTPEKDAKGGGLERNPPSLNPPLGVD